ncbi:zinc-ribbon and DUF3426 domain-containing protein [Methylohalobius crimeensis]|uniref:zinc-ribbon and DUF3426 domain-containing protein n=1 Tax=Methylohalobius crimeensis TaxID=244365 RepID=UPI0003B62EF3|nr:zinc-ribbon and DUF3426 domain-containing protein [Methylohalobius crimeensis]
MYTRCPHCRTVYQINVAQLRSGRGEAICARCNIIFGVLEYLGEDLEEAFADHTTCLLELPLLKADRAVAVAPEPSQPEAPPERAQAEAATEPQITLPETHLDASLAETPPSLSTDRYWQVGAVALGLLLIIQIFVFERERIAQEPHLRPLLAGFCHWLGCELPPFRNLDAIEVVDRALYPSKNAANGYEFHLVIVNHGPYPQPYPLLKLTLTALDGTAIAQRIFKPEEYLSAVPAPMMPTHQLIFVHLTPAAPHRAVGGFQFEFL